MPRAKGQDGRYVQLRAELEHIQLELVDCEEVAPLIRLRIEQAIRRAGLDALLSPAVQDLDRLVRDVAQAKSRLSSAVDVLLRE